MRRPGCPGCFQAPESHRRYPSAVSNAVETAALLTPCIGVCTLGEDGQCLGCWRSGEEIARWSRMNDEERLYLMDHILPERERLARHAVLPEREALRHALYPLDRIPHGRGCNHDELADLLPHGVLREAAVLVGLVPRAAGTAVLLTRRTDDLRHHGGQVSFPGGAIDRLDAGVVAAALRESHEEIALAAAQVEPLGFLDPFSTISGFRVTPVVAVVDRDFVARPNPDEVAEVFEVPLAYLLEPRNLRQVELDYRGRRRAVLEYDWPGQRIWGATAAILANLRQRLQAAP